VTFNVMSWPEVPVNVTSSRWPGAPSVEVADPPSVLGVIVCPVMSGAS